MYTPLQTECREIALHGSYYEHNFGDELLLALYARWIRETGAGIAVNAPLASEEMMRAIGADSRGMSGLRRVMGLVYGGGGYFGEQPVRPIRWGFRNLLRYAPPAVAMELRARPYAIIGVGAGPLSNRLTRRAIVRLCSRADVVAVRDEESCEYLRGFGVRREDVVVTADAALTIGALGDRCSLAAGSDPPLGYRRRERNIGIHLLLPREMSHFSELLVGGLIRFATKHPETAFVFFADSRREGVTSEDQRPSGLVMTLIQQLGARSSFVPYKEPLTLLNLLASLDMVITTKLHVGIAAVALGIPVVSLPYHYKVARFYRQVNASDHCVPLAELDSGRLWTVLSDIYAQGLPRRVAVPPAVLQRAFANRTLLQRFVASCVEEV